jgi:hypothetical protein
MGTMGEGVIVLEMGGGSGFGRSGLVVAMTHTPGTPRFRFRFLAEASEVFYRFCHRQRYSQQ